MLHSVVTLKKNAASDMENTNSSSRSQNTRAGGGLRCLTMTEVKYLEQGTGSRAAFGHTPTTTFAQDRASKHSSTQLPTPAQHAAFSKKELAMSLEHTAVETLVLLVARNNGCVLPPSRLPQ